MRDALVSMAELGITAQLGAMAGNSSAPSSFALLDVCHSLSVQHGATLQLEPAIAHANKAEEALLASIDALKVANATVAEACSEA